MKIPFFIPKLQVFKSLTKISVYDILTNNFKVDVTQKLKPQYCVPMKKYFDEICFYYDILNDSRKSTVIRYNSWSDLFILFNLVFNVLKCLSYIFWNEDDPLIRLYGGNLEYFFGSNVLYFAILEAGATLYCVASYHSVYFNIYQSLNSIG